MNVEKYHCDEHKTDIIIYGADEVDLFQDNDKREIAIFTDGYGNRYLKRFVYNGCNEQCETLSQLLSCVIVSKPYLITGALENCFNVAEFYLDFNIKFKTVEQRIKIFRLFPNLLFDVECGYLNIINEKLDYLYNDEKTITKTEYITIKELFIEQNVNLEGK